MAITSLSLSLDRDHYSRYELSRAEIAATVIASGTPGDSYEVKLSRQSHGGEREITSATVVLSASPQTTVTRFDLTSLVDADGHNPIRVSERVGDYRLTATGDGQESSSSMTIAPMSAEEFTSRWLRGLPLTQAEKLVPRLQPQVVTGVTITGVGIDSKPGGNTLEYKATAGTLRWQNGPLLTLDLGLTSYVMGDSATGFIEITVNHGALPVSDKTELIFIEEGRMTDAEIIREILGTYAEVQHGLQVYLEPTHIVSPLILSEPTAPTWYDVTGLPVAFIRKWNVNYLEAKLPYRPVLDVKQFMGFFNESRVVQLDKDWRVHNEANGVIQLIPTSGAILSFVWSIAGLQSFLWENTHVPNFWQYAIIAGFRDVPPEVLEYAMKRAAIKVLSQVGATRYAAGVTNLSISRDGVSESRGINPKGPYAAIIETYASEIGRGQQGGQDKELVRLKMRLRGISFVTL
jgi:hypothetical protein